VNKPNFFPPYLNQGSKRAAVAGLKMLLSRRGFLILVPGRICTEYDEATAQAVQDLQRYCELRGDDIDGNFGPITREAYEKEFGISPEDEIQSWLAALSGDTEWLGPDHEGYQTWPPAEDLSCHFSVVDREVDQAH